MRKVFALLALLVVAGISVTAAYAADLQNPSSCGGAGSYHFVLNHAAGTAGSQTLTVNGVNYGTSDFVVAGGKVAQWTIDLTAPLSGASTSGDGKLVLSDFSCKKGGSPKK